MSKAEQLRQMQARINELESQLEQCQKELEEYKKRPVTIADKLIIKEQSTPKK